MLGTLILDYGWTITHGELLVASRVTHDLHDDRRHNCSAIAIALIKKSVVLSRLVYIFPYVGDLNIVYELWACVRADRYMYAGGSIRERKSKECG